MSTGQKISCTFTVLEKLKAILLRWNQLFKYFFGLSKNWSKIFLLNMKKYQKGYWYLNPLSADPTKWPNTLKQFVGKLPTNCLSVFDRFMRLALKGLKMFLVLQLEQLAWIELK